jgi:hypothetical protein
MARIAFRLSPHSFARLRGLSKRRLDTLPYPGLLLAQVLRRVQPE